MWKKYRGIEMPEQKTFDRIIIGAGLYGLYAALRCGSRGERVLVLEQENGPFRRATYINQARVHMGYHYPRSLTTACRSAGYYRRFHEEFSFAINDHFEQIYALSSQFSWTDAEEFRNFCRAAGIRCETMAVDRFFRPGMCDGAFLTEEDTYDASILRDWFVDRLKACPHVDLCYGAVISSIRKDGKVYAIDYRTPETGSGGSNMHSVLSGFILNATYASANQVLQLAKEGDPDGSYDPFRIKYELCEIILCRPSEEMKKFGITVMDGPFFSVMPFGKTGFHSLTAVTFTPHCTSYTDLPVFSCQKGTGCTPQQLCSCNECLHRPKSSWPYMSHLAEKYLKDDFTFQYEKSLYSMKPILKSSEVDDSRPTAIRINSRDPVFISVLSGKINTVYDLDRYL
jgi:hypothetical protein